MSGILIVNGEKMALGAIKFPAVRVVQPASVVNKVVEEDEIAEEAEVEEQVEQAQETEAEVKSEVVSYSRKRGAGKGNKRG